MREVIWDKPKEVPEWVIENVDENVLAKLPPGTRIEGIYPHGTSYWTRTAAIKTSQADNRKQTFFLKVSHHESGKDMMSSEFVSMTLIRNTVPDIAPLPIAWGTYAIDSDIHFYLCSFHDMTDDIPEIQPLAAKVAELHGKGLSPNGKYGFSVPTYQSKCPEQAADGSSSILLDDPWPQPVEWKSSWEEFFLISLKWILEKEEESQGYDAQLSSLKQALFEKVVPRLLRPLETGGNRIEPRLVHGDLWDGNCSTDIATNMPIIFDATSTYAHNEYELAPWRPPRHNIGKHYIEAYTRYFPPSAPQSDFDDRLTLYCIRFDSLSSALYPGNLRFRNIIMVNMRLLVEKFPNGYEGTHMRKRSEG
ncbi:MAG: hypothetical protein HETSPECPRED_000883 [Heterodermia speciosa]|uniref:protein-ribulosamine 3-kinase n=1 Tax=Heterodermia speciosa TaxID=116794 RepID=A0A8H3ERR0_9LECA|nr:MAG: hypothetical protein HETSPECPRED_000883 [Heterodermia speciosa]